MTSTIDLLLMLLMLTNLALLGTSRIVACIRTAAFQGILLGLLTLATHTADLTARVVLLAIGSMILKAWVFPWLLGRAQREAGVRREVEPYVGFTLSILMGLAAMGASFWLGSRLPPSGPAPSALLAPAAFFTIASGLFLIVSRRNALSQVLGYLVLENGIFAFGVALALEEPFLVEMGVLLDVFVAVFVMGIAIFHINREFDHIDVDRLTVLKG